MPGCVLLLLRLDGGVHVLDGYAPFDRADSVTFTGGHLRNAPCLALERRLTPLDCSVRSPKVEQCDLPAARGDDHSGNARRRRPWHARAEGEDLVWLRKAADAGSWGPHIP